MSNTKFTTGTEWDSERDYQPDGTKRRRITVFILILHSGPIWRVRGGIGPKGARGLVLVSIPRVLGMGNPLRPFSDTPD